jgi:hypothetical protein
MSASDDETKLLGDTVHFLPTINCSNLLTKFMPQAPCLVTEVRSTTGCGGHYAKRTAPVHSTEYRRERISRGMASKPQQDPELSSRLKKTNDELKQLQDSVKTGMINVKVLMDFRVASERARQASVAVQRWLDSQGKGNDPYQLMNEVMRQRVEMTTQLVKDVARDLESLDLDFDTPGLPALNQAVQTLAERLTKLFPQKS